MKNILPCSGLRMHFRFKLFSYNTSSKISIKPKCAIVALFFLLASFFTITVNAQSWYNANWSYRKAITIDYTKVGAGPHTNFPVLISRADVDLQTKALASGNDILFTSADGTTKLSHEIESYTSASGTIVAWVEIPSLSSSANSVIYMYFGNAAATSQQDVAGTWDATFRGVYHFNQSYLDATSNNYSGTNAGTFDMPGKISRGRGYNRTDGNGDLITIAGQMGSPASITVSAWVNLNSSDVNGTEVISLGDHVILRMYGATTQAIFYNGSTWLTTTVNTGYTGGWHHLSYTFTSGGNNQKLYVDGVQAATSANTGAISYAGFGANTIIGAHGNGATGFYFDGTLDEARVSSSVRSAGWTLTEYNNQNSPSTFFSVGTLGYYNKTFTGTGNFSDATKWTGGTLPAVGENLIIDGNCTVDNNAGTNNIAYGTLIIGTATGRILNWVASGTNRLNVSNVSNGSATSTLDMTNGGTLVVRGSLLPTNLSFTPGTGTVEFQSTLSIPAAPIFNNITINGAGNTASLSASLTLTGNLTITAGTFNANNFGITVTGNWINNSSVTGYTAGTGITTFNGGLAQSIGGTFVTTFNNVTIAKSSGTITLNVNAAIAGNLSVNTGTLNLATFTANRTSAGGTLTVANNATLKIGGTNTLPTNYTTNTLVVASTVEYSGINQTVASQTYGNLTLSSSAGAAVKTLPATALAVVGNLTSTLGAGTSVSFTAASVITVNGNVSIGASTTFTGGSYNHSIGGNWANSGTFTGSTGTITFTGPGSAINGTGAQNFNNLTVSGSGITFSANSITLTGNLSTTGSGSFIQAAGGTVIMSGTAKTITGTSITISNLTISGTVSAAVTIILSGNLSVTGSFTLSSGIINMSGSSKTITGAGSMAFYVLTVSGSVTTTANFSIASGLVVEGSFTASAGTATFTGTSYISGTANLYSSTINGTSLQLAAGSVMGIANVFTITSGTLNAATSGPNTVNFNGSGAQNINGIAYSNLILSNGNTKTATGAITTAYNLTIGTGTTFNPATYTHSIYGNWVNNGIFTPGTSTVQFLGPATAYITGATTFNILTSNTSSSTTDMILQSNVSAAIVNMTNGIINTGSNTLTITNTRTGNGFIYGNIQRTHAFTTGVAYAFEGPDNTISFSSVSSVTSVTVSVTRGAVSDFPFGGSVSRVYNITVPAGTYNATLRLHYEDVELNGNTESSLNLWNYTGSLWSSVGKTAGSTTSNYLEQSGLTNITNRWTCSDDANLVQWNGSVSTDWNTAANWTILQGSASKPPSSTDLVNLGGASFINQPTISNSVTVKNIVFGSAQAVTLSIADGGTLTTTGDINGNWSSNTTHTINVNNQSLIVNGNIDLSDGTNGHAINVSIGTGTLTTLGSLTQSGGANIIYSGAGTLNIFKDFTYTSGTFTPSGGTVFYNGNQNQDIGGVNYNNLTVNKSAGQAAINDSISIGGDLLISSGQLDNYASATISGNVTLSSGASFTNHQVLHVLGNWNNSGNFTGAGAGIFFEGTGAQSISATTFGNLNINKPSGTATLTGNVLLTGDLTISSGTFDIQAYSFDRNLPGGTATTINGATFMIGANNPPRNFTHNIIGPSSTTILYGTVPMFLGLSGITFGNIIFRGSGAKTTVADMTVNGDLTIDSLSNFNPTTATVTLNGNMINKGTFIPATSTVLFNGISKTLTGNTTFNKATAAGSYTFLSNMTFNNLLNITSTGSLSAGSTILTTMNGDLINSGVLYTLGTTTFTGNVPQTLSLINAIQTVAITVNFNGTVSPVLNSTSAPQYGYLNINNTGGVNPSVGWIVLYALNVASGASFNLGTPSHTIFGSLTNNGTITSAGTLTFMPSSPVTLNMGSNFSSTGRVYFGGTGAITLAGTPVSFYNLNINNSNAAGISPSSNWTITRELRVVAGSILNAGSYTHQVGGNIFNTGTINSGTSTFIINGSGAQDINTPSAFNNITLNKSGGLTTLSLNATVNNVLNFVAGKLQTGSYSLIMPSTASVTGAAQNTGWINGNLQKNIATGATNKTFETGDSASYTPVSLAFANVTTAGNLTVFTTIGDHSNISSSVIKASKSLNRFWTLANNGIAFTNYNATFNFVAADVDAGANTASFNVTNYNGSSWSLPVTASRNSTNIQATSVTSFGDFAVGEICNNGTAISYSGSPYCSNSGTASVTLTGTTGGTFSSDPALSINSSTGTIDLNASTPGIYTVTYTLAAAGDCAVYLITAGITISTAPAATISYGASPYCAGAGTASVTFAGTSGGAYSSTSGLTINSVSGDISLATSTAGTYTVTYTVAASNGCAVYTTTTTVQIYLINNNQLDYTNGSHGAVCSVVGENGFAVLTAPAGTVFITVNFASYGTPSGTCGAFIIGNCHAATSQSVTQNYLLGNTTATIPATNNVFGDPCVGTYKQLNVQATYTNPTCAGTAPGTISGSTPTGGGTYTYLWEQSTTSSSSEFSSASGTNNTKDYIPGVLTQTTWYRRTVITGGCSDVSPVLQMKVVTSGTWSGAVNTAWNTGGNWICGAVPTSATNVIIPAGLANYPVLNTGTGAVQNITIASGASVTVTTAILQIAGIISNSGTFTAGNGTIEFNGNSAQTIPASAFAGNKIKNLILSNNVSLAGQDSVTGVLSFGNVNNKTFTSGGYLTLKSNSSNTAALADITNNSINSGNTISGNVTVERYLSSLNNRAYRLVASSVNTATSIHNHWQEGATSNLNNPNPGYGTHITGTTVDQTNGFDATVTSQASLFTYNQVTSAWVAAPNTNSALLNAQTGYLLYVRGDRSINLGSQSAPLPTTNVTLRATGTLLTGTQIFSGLAGNAKFSLITNPFASSVNWTTVQAAATGVTNAYSFWDANYGTRGGFVTVNTSGIASSGTATQNIQSGQAFFVQASGVSSPTVTVREIDKSSTNNIDVFSPTYALQTFSTSLYFTQADGTRRIADGVINVFNNNYSALIDDNDAEEINNWDENIAIDRNNKHLSIESRPVIIANDTIPLFINHLKQQTYQFEFVAANLYQQGLTGYLKDNFLPLNNAPVNLNDTTRINFTVTGDPLSYAANRFQIVFNSLAPLPVRLTNLKAYQQGANIAVEWKVENELNMKQYEVERSADGMNFIKMADIAAAGRNNYNWLDLNHLNGNNYYRIKSTDVDGHSKLSGIVKVNVTIENQSISVHPNPIENGVLSLSMVNMPKGIYEFKIVNNLGQVLLKKTIRHPEGSSTETILLGKNISAGTYILEIIKPDNKTLTNKIYVK